MESLFDFVSTRHGVFSRLEANTLGVSNSQISTRVRNGQFLRVAPSVYAIAGAPNTWEQRARVAALSTRGLVSHQAAAYVHGIDGFQARDIEVIVPKYRRPAGAGFRLHRTTQFGRADGQEVDGVPVTGLPRTVLDVAAVVGPKRLNWMVDAVIRQGMVEWEDLFHVWVIHSIQGRNGSGRLRELLEERYGDDRVPDSKWNRMVSDLLINAGLPAPLLEHEIRSNGRFIGRVDLAYPEERLAIELDSSRWHLNSESFVKDPRRKNQLTLAGWTVLTFTWTDYSDTPGALINTVRQARLSAA